MTELLTQDFDDWPDRRRWRNLPGETRKADYGWQRANRRRAGVTKDQGVPLLAAPWA
jgi:hypothetical protein